MMTQVLTFLEEKGPSTTKQIADYLGKEEGDINPVISSMGHSGVIVRGYKSSRWCISDRSNLAQAVRRLTLAIYAQAIANEKENNNGMDSMSKV